MAKRLVSPEKQLGRVGAFDSLTRGDEESFSFRAAGQFGGMWQRGAGVDLRSALGLQTEHAVFPKRRVRLSKPIARAD